MQVAQRLDRLLTLLRPISPPLHRWYQVVSEDDVRELEPGARWLVNAVAASVCTGDLGEPAPALGYMPLTLNAPTTDPPRPDDVFLDITCGSMFINTAALRPTHFQDLDPLSSRFRSSSKQCWPSRKPSSRIGARRGPSACGRI